MAMREEAAPLVAALALRRAPRLDDHLPIETFISSDASVVVAVNGVDPLFHIDAIGTQPASVTTTLIARAYDPDVILSAGTAGAFQAAGAAIGDIYLSRSIAFHDRRIALPGFDTYGRCVIETPEALPVAEALGFKTGNVTSGNSLDLPDHDLKSIRSLDGHVKDMEAASVAWVARQYGKRMYAVK
jgi:nucleoside phosphorylase